MQAVCKIPTAACFFKKILLEMKLSIIIVNYNVKYFLEQCLCSILKSNIDFAYEIIIVDNNSTDDSLSYLKPRFTQSFIHFIGNHNNPGFAKANNQGIRQAKGEYILILNPDTVLGENVLKNVIHFFEQTPDAGAAGVKMINGQGRFLPESKRGIPTPWVSFCKISGLQSVFPKSTLFGKYNLLYLDKNSIHRVPILAGAFMMIRYNALEKAGLFDEAFFMYGEDIDLSYRISESGYKNYYLPETILHYKGESTDKNNQEYINAFYNAMLIFYRKHYPNSNPIFSSVISSAIKLKLLFSKPKRRTENIIKQTKTFDCSTLSFEQIIQQMENISDNRTQFLIYSPYTRQIIGTNTTSYIPDDAPRE